MFMKWSKLSSWQEKKELAYLLKKVIEKALSKIDLDIFFLFLLLIESSQLNYLNERIKLNF